MSKRNVLAAAIPVRAFLLFGCILLAEPSAQAVALFCRIGESLELSYDNTAHLVIVVQRLVSVSAFPELQGPLTTV